MKILEGLELDCCFSDLAGVFDQMNLLFSRVLKPMKPFNILDGIV
jgi:hypothetical protein